MAFINSSSILLEVKDFYLFLLMYADDMVIFFLSPFQDCKICLMLYMNIHLNGHLSVNTSKTKIVVFRNGGKMNVNEKWFYDNKEIKIVDRFTYLGVLLNYNGSYNILQYKLSEQGIKAVVALRRSIKSMYLNCTTLLSLFDTYINSILSYGCEA